MGSLAVVVPTFNHFEGLERLISALPGEVVVVDDGSTAVLPTEGAVRLRHDQRRGYGAALLTGFTYALERGFERIATIDADGQHDPADLLRLLDFGADIVSGSRFHPQSARRGLPPPPSRQAVHQAVLQRLNGLTGWGLTDAFCGLKVYRSAALRQLSLDEPGYAMPLQLWLQAHRLGLSVLEVPVACIYHGASPGRPLDEYLRVLSCSTCSR